MTPWATKPFARVHWKDAPTDDPKLDELLEAATEQCVPFGRVVQVDVDGNPVDVPLTYKLAVVYQARELYNAAQRGESDVIGVGDYAIRARPLTAAVKQLLRPKRARGGVG